MRGLAGKLMHGGLLGLVSSVSVLAAPHAVSASPTPDQCKVISAVAVKVIRAVGPGTLSVEFRQSFRDWMGPDLQCNGPRRIATPTPNDVAALNTIRGVLLQGPHPISLKDYGVYAAVDDSVK